MKQLTPKQREFRNCLFNGMTQRESWGAAGYSTNYPVECIDSHASRLANLDKMKVSLEEMRQAAESPLIADEIERKEILSEILRGKVAQFVDEDGVIDRKKLDSSAIQAIDEHTVGGRARILKLRLHNPMQAADILNKMDNSYEQPPAGVQDNRVFNIIVSSEKAKELTANISNRFLKAGEAQEEETED